MTDEVVAPDPAVIEQNTSGVAEALAEHIERTSNYLMLESSHPPHNTIRGPLESFTPSLEHWIRSGWVDVTEHRLGINKACPMCRQFRNLTGNTTEGFWELGWDEVAGRSEVVLWCNPSSTGRES